MREIKLLADERCAEPLSDLLMDAGALSATIEDADADRPDDFDEEDLLRHYRRRPAVRN